MAFLPKGRVSNRSVMSLLWISNVSPLISSPFGIWCKVTMIKIGNGRFWEDLGGFGRIFFVLYLRFTQKFHNCSYLMWCEGFACRDVMPGSEFKHERGTTLYPVHEMLDCSIRIAVWEVQKSQFFLWISADIEFFHCDWYFGLLYKFSKKIPYKQMI